MSCVGQHLNVSVHHGQQLPCRQLHHTRLSRLVAAARRNALAIGVQRSCGGIRHQPLGPVMGGGRLPQCQRVGDEVPNNAPAVASRLRVLYLMRTVEEGLRPRQCVLGGCAGCDELLVTQPVTEVCALSSFQ